MMNMKETGKKISRFMTLCMGITISVVLASFGVIMSGHFTVPMLLLSICISITLALLVGFIIPIRKICDKTTGKISNKIAKTLINALITNIFYVLIITTTMSAIMIGLANRNISMETDNLKDEISSVSQSIAENEAELSKLTPSDTEYSKIQGSIGELNGRLKALEGELNGKENGRPDFAKSLPKSLASSYVVSYILCLIAEPIYMKIAVKKYVKKDGSPKIK